MARAVCLRCGEEKPAYDRICPACGHRPEGDGLLVGWLLSDQHLNDAQLQEAAARIRRKESIRPSDRQLDVARRALGLHADADPGLPTGARWTLLALHFALTPMIGWVLWWWWRTERPRASTQAFWLAAPATVLLTAGFAWRWAVVHVAW